MKKVPYRVQVHQLLNMILCCFRSFTLNFQLDYTLSEPFGQLYAKINQSLHWLLLRAVFGILILQVMLAQLLLQLHPLEVSVVARRLTKINHGGGYIPNNACCRRSEISIVELRWLLRQLISLFASSKPSFEHHGRLYEC